MVEYVDQTEYSVQTSAVTDQECRGRDEEGVGWR